MPTTSDHDPSGRRLLRCDKCRQTKEVTHADLMACTRTGWPKCCGQTMGYFIEAVLPTDPAADEPATRLTALKAPTRS
jgi:hypothetical protein